MMKWRVVLIFDRVIIIKISTEKSIFSKARGLSKMPTYLQGYIVYICYQVFAS